MQLNLNKENNSEIKAKIFTKNYQKENYQAI